MSLSEAAPPPLVGVNGKGPEVQRVQSGVALEVLTSALRVINTGNEATQQIVDRLGATLAADARVAVVAFSGDRHLVSATYPDEEKAEGLAAYGQTVQRANLRPYMETNDPALGHMVGVHVVPAPNVRMATDSSVVLAFCRKDGFRGDYRAVLECLLPALTEFWPVAWCALGVDLPTPVANPEDLGLSERETQVLRLLSMGLLATSIASRLELSPRTVHKHLGNIYRKLGVHDRLVAVRIARNAGVLPS